MRNERPAGRATDRILGLAAGMLLMSACAAVYPYRYYGLELHDRVQDSKLTRKDPKDDLSLERCLPDAESKGKCWVYLDAEHELIKRERAELIRRLEACERGKAAE